MPQPLSLALGKDSSNPIEPRQQCQAGQRGGRGESSSSNCDLKAIAPLEASCTLCSQEAVGMNVPVPTSRRFLLLQHILG